MQQVTLVGGPLGGQVKEINPPDSHHCDGYAYNISVSFFVSEIQFPMDLWTHSIAYYDLRGDEAHYRRVTAEIHTHPHKNGYSCICTTEPGY